MWPPPDLILACRLHVYLPSQSDEKQIFTRLNIFIQIMNVAFRYCWTSWDSMKTSWTNSGTTTSSPSQPFSSQSREGIVSTHTKRSSLSIKRARTWTWTITTTTPRSHWMSASENNSTKDRSISATCARNSKTTCRLRSTNIDWRTVWSTEGSTGTGQCRLPRESDTTWSCGWEAPRFVTRCVRCATQNQRWLKRLDSEMGLRRITLMCVLWNRATCTWLPNV